MSKLILTGLCTASLGVGACGHGEQEYNGANTNHDRDDDRYADNGFDYGDVGSSTDRSTAIAADNEPGSDDKID